MSGSVYLHGNLRPVAEWVWIDGRNINRSSLKGYALVGVALLNFDQAVVLGGKRCKRSAKCCGLKMNIRCVCSRQKYLKRKFCNNWHSG